MEVSQRFENITFSPEGADTKISVPGDIIFRIFEYLKPRDIAAFTSTCKNHYNLTKGNNERWKPIILNLVPTLPDHLTPTSWFGLPSLRHQAKVNLLQGKFATTHTQEGVSHMIPYGMRKGEEATRVVLFKDGGKQVESWDLEGEPTKLFTSEIPYEPTEITWNSKGEPQLLLLDKPGFKWACLNLANSEKTMQGSEKNWNYKGLSSEYCQCAKGQQVGLWETQTGDLSQHANPIPIHTLEGEVLFLLMSQPPSVLSICSQTQHDSTALTRAWLENTQPLLVQPTASSPQYLAAILLSEETLRLWNTSDWKQTELGLIDLELHGWGSGKLHYVETMQGPTLIAHQWHGIFWMTQFDVEAETWSATRKGQFSNFSPVCDHLVRQPFSNEPSILQVSVSPLDRDPNPLPGTLSVWNPDEEAPTPICWEIPGLQYLAPCTTPKGQPLRGNPASLS